MVEWTASLRLRAALTAAPPARLSLSGAQHESIISHSGGLNAFWTRLEYRIEFHLVDALSVAKDRDRQ
jgi:hypothetical protein